MKDLKFKVRTVHDRGEDNMNINGYLDLYKCAVGTVVLQIGLA